MNSPFSGLEGVYLSRLVLGHLLTSISRDCFVIAVPICLINRPHPRSLTTALRLLHLKILPTARCRMMQRPVLRRRRCKAGSEFEVSVLAEAVPSIFKHGQMDILDIFDSFRAHKRFCVRNHPEVSPALIGNRCACHTFVVVSPETA